MLLALKNRRLLKRAQRYSLDSVRDELVTFIASIDIQNLLKNILRHHKNLTCDEHDRLFKILRRANSRSKQKQVSTEDRTLCSLNSMCLSHMITFLDVNSCISLQRSCSKLFIVNSEKQKTKQSKNIIIKQEPLDNYKESVSTNIVENDKVIKQE